MHAINLSSNVHIQKNLHLFISSITKQILPVPVLLLQPMVQGTVVKAMKQMLIVICIISVTVDIMLLVMSTEHVILAGIGPGVLQSVWKVIVMI